MKTAEENPSQYSPNQERISLRLKRFKIGPYESDNSDNLDEVIFDQSDKSITFKFIGSSCILLYLILPV